MQKIKVIGLCLGILLSACNGIPLETALPTPEISPTAEIKAQVQSTQIATATDPASMMNATATSTDSPTPIATQTATPKIVEGERIVVDHTSVEKFDLIPDEVLAQAAQLRVLFRHASVGENIRYGLECMYGDFGGRYPSSCAAFHDLKYDSTQWDFQFRGNPGWIEKVDDFVRETDAQSDQYDVFMFTVGYLDGLDNTTFPEISNPEEFANNYVNKLEDLEIRHLDKTFIWWSMSLSQEGHQNTQRFNEALRNYAAENSKIFVDLADLETYDPKGNPCFSEDQLQIICKDYTNEKVSGHLNEGGRERIAKAFWYLMARLTGWKE